MKLAPILITAALFATILSACSDRAPADVQPLPATNDAEDISEPGDAVSQTDDIIPSDAAHLNCIQTRLPISNISVSDVQRNDMLRYVTVTFDVTNNLTFPVAGFTYDLELLNEGADTPFYNDRALREVPEIAAPGDIMTATTSAALPRDMEPPFTAQIAIVNVGDEDRRPLFNETGVSGWADTLSDEVCGDG
ncbi:hypothetical protein [Henriciella litoralis]|uniref:hypothetical protein n=1 Tax=Henriciella litoralis TaxID=568102 RepID=UPI0009FEF838|nr:hypothetical protein [Henriciella litoralis]